MSDRSAAPFPVAPGPTARPGIAPKGPADIDRAIARLLTIGTLVSIAAMAVGTVLLLAGGGSPKDNTAPAFDLAALPAQLLALQPAAFVWVGLIVIIATPSARVLASLIAYLRSGEREMAVVAVLILAVIAASVLVAAITEG